MRLPLVALLALTPHPTTSECSPSCSAEFVDKCVPFHNRNGNDGYAACRRSLDDGNAKLVAKGCVAGCTDTADMVAAQQTASSPTATPGPTATCSGTNPTIFTANAQRTVQLMPCTLCAQFSERSNCEVTFDVPAACAGDAGKSCPLLFFFHGSGGTNDGWPNSAGASIHAASAGFIGVYPQGAPKESGKTGWSTGGATVTTGGIDDTAFVTAIVHTFRADYGWDSRLYAYGSSNGAAMCQRLGVNGRMGFTGIAPVATQLLAKPPRSGPGENNWNQPGDDACTVPIAYVSFSGLLDSTIAYDGSKGPPGADPSLVSLMPVVESNAAWASNNGCGADATMESLPAVAKSGDTTAEHYTWSSCQSTAPTEHYKIVGGGHEAARTINGDSLTKISLAFFAAVEAKCVAAPEACPGSRSSLPLSCSESSPTTPSSGSPTSASVDIPTTGPVGRPTIAPLSSPTPSPADPPMVSPVASNDNIDEAESIASSAGPSSSTVAAVATVAVLLNSSP